MDFRVSAGVLLVACCGCFVEPPNESGGDASSGASTSSGADSGTSTGSSGAGGSTTSAPTSADTSSGSSSSSTGGCVDVSVEPEVVNPDIILVLDEGVPFDGTLAMGIGRQLESPQTNVAVFVPGPGASDFPMPFDCEAGCESCNEAAAQRVLFPYEGTAFGSVADAIGDGELNCVLRPPPTASSSGPARHLWLLTQEPTQTIPGGFENAVLAAGFRLHVACPGCDDELPEAAEALQSAVDATFGTVADITAPMQIGEQVGLMMAARHSCRWDSPGTPVEVRIETSPLGGGAESYTFFSTEAGAGCASSSDDAGYFFDGPHLQLCPYACLATQEWPAMLTEITPCE